jgi:hypothetical protein
VSSNRKPAIQIAWKTVTYRSVALAILGVAILFFIGLRFAFPQFTANGLKAADNFGNKLLEAVAGAAGPEKAGSMDSQHARITQLDGTVRVKKANGNSWMNADYNVPLDKGDVIQTGSEGMAKIVFNDGTNYTVKQDSLIVIEENSTNEQQQTNVAIAVSTGTVDLTTAMYNQGSKSLVTVAGATASIAPDSAARVSNDPKLDQHEILVTKGDAEVTHNGEVTHLAPWEKVNGWTPAQAHLEKVKEIGPPVPISPANMMPIFVKGAKSIEFSWTKMTNAVGYRIQIAHNPNFTKVVVNRKVDTADILISGLTEGVYYWMVQSYDANGKESSESEKNRFNIIPKQDDSVTITLDLDPMVQHGHVIELTGKTEVEARVMVNGQEVPVIGTDGTFHYFTPPLPLGESVITITAQNKKGGVKTEQKKVVIQ